MLIKYDTEKLGKLINDLSNLLGISMSVLDSNFSPLVSCKSEYGICSKIQASENGLELCRCSDESILEKCKKSLKLETHICHAGLCDAAMPIMKNGIIVGYIIMGRIRTEIKTDDVKKRLEWTGIPPEIIEKNYQELSYFSKDRVESLRSLLSYVLFENAIEIPQDELITRTTEYISSNIKNDLSVQEICNKVGVSKNILYRLFFEHYGTTIGNYVTDKRIEKAKELLIKTKDPVYSVAESVGIGNYTYFCKLFSTKVGISPLKYRKLNSK